EGSLLAVLDRTMTTMGARLLADWLANPLADRETIEARQGAVAELVADARLTADLREKLRGTYEIQRVLTRVVTGRPSPRDPAHIGQTLSALPAIKAKLTGRQSGLLARLESEIDLCPEIRQKLESALVDPCPLQAREGGIIRDGYHQSLDGLRELA